MKDTTHRVALYRRVPKDDPAGGEYGLYKLKDEDRLFAKPTLLCCGGMYINAHQRDPELDIPNGEKSASGFAKIGHKLLGYKNRITQGDPVDIVSVVYPEPEWDLGERSHTLARKTFERKATYSRTADNFVYDHIEPLLLDSKKHPLDLQTVEKNLRNIHILAHSHGGAFVRQVGNALHTRMRELDFSDDEIREATSQVLVVTIGTSAPLGAGRASFTTIDMLHAEDERAGAYHPSRHNQSDMIRALFQRNGRLDEQDKTRPANPLTVMPIRLSTQPGVMLKHKKDSRHCLVYDSAPKRPAVSLHNHQVNSYFGFGADSNMLSIAASSALANGLNNALQNASSEAPFIPLQTPMELLKCPEKMLYMPETGEGAAGENFIQIADRLGYHNQMAAACASHAPMHRG